MGLWALITATLIIQEFATSALALVLAEHSGVSLWPIHIIWAATTMFDMYVGYQLGALLKKHLEEYRFTKKIDRWIKRGSKGLGPRGTNIALMILGVINFPYLNAFIGAWLELPMNVTMLFTFIGNFVWYLLLWGTVLGVTSFIQNPSMILLVIVGIGVLSHFTFKIVERSQKKRRKSSRQ